jgi:NitT/TauT family transport system substrate-binding protein
MIELGSASEVIRAYKNGTIEVAALTLDEVLFLKSQRFDPVIILVLDISQGGDVILAKKGLDSMTKLRGKRIGVEDTALGAYVISRALEINGMTSDQIEMVPIEFSEHEQAYLSGEVDAVTTFEPVKSQLIGQGATMVFSSLEIPGEIVDVLVTPKKLLHKRSDAIQDLINGWRSAHTLLHTRPETAAQKIAQRHQSTSIDLKLFFDGLFLPGADDNIELFQGPLEQSVEKLQSVMLKNKLIQKQTDTKGLFDASFLREEGES